jgi:hypothetical protein
MTKPNNANNIKICNAIKGNEFNGISPYLDDILPLDFDIDEKRNVSKEFGNNTKIENGIGKGFMKEDSSHNCEYYWDNNKNDLYRRVVDFNSYAGAAYSGTPVVKPFIKQNKVRIDFVTKKCKKNILKYNPFPDKIYTLYEKNINADYYLKNKQTKTGSSKRKHLPNKKNKAVKHYKILNDQPPNLDYDGHDDYDYDDYDDYYYDDYDDYYYDDYDDYDDYYKTGRYINRFFGDSSDDDDGFDYNYKTGRYNNIFFCDSSDDYDRFYY